MTLAETAGTTPLQWRRSKQAARWPPIGRRATRVYFLPFLNRVGRGQPV